MGRLSPNVKFGTSGLRGPASDFDAETVSSYVEAFLHVCGSAPEQVIVASDLRSGSPAIVQLVLSAVSAAGFEPVWAGQVPTPALAAYAMAQNVPGIMVTGSHIPESHNGIKFYRRDSELLKGDEVPILERAKQGPALQTSPIDLGAPDPRIAGKYVERYLGAFPERPLAGIKLGVDMHSAVGRDLLVETLEGLGAQVFPYRRLEQFLAVDTEAMPEADINLAKEQIALHGLDAIVSTDGDGDRPLLIDETGQQINGDVLGALAARQLNIRHIVTPLNSTTAIDKSGWFEQVTRTRIGSPYVVVAMQDLEAGPVAGFEANGGFLLGSVLRTDKGSLDALPTRDAVLPLIAVLMAAKEAEMPLSEVTRVLPPRFMLADKLPEIPHDKSQKLLTDLVGSEPIRSVLNPRLALPVAVDLTDGLRFTLDEDVIVHFRQSGNAPELRCYVETSDPGFTRELLAELMSGLPQMLERSADI